MKLYEYARFKRCLEMYASDPDFRERMNKDPDEAIRSAQFQQDLEGYPVRDAILWILFRKGNSQVIRLNPYFKQYLEYQQEIGRMIIREHEKDAIASPEMYEYLLETRKRCREENELIRSHDLIYYYPVAIELSDGCSLHCPFCGFRAGKFRGYFPYTPENASLFRSILETLQTYAGELLSSCPCYYATEPMDNPDYERFMMEIKEMTGHVPQTTTAVAEAVPERIRAYMATIGKEELKGRAALRFSIRSLEQFRKIMALYTPEELVYVELLANNPESVNRYSDSGRAMENRNFKEDKRVSYSISCTAGLRINLCTRRIEFMEPVTPDERYPLGYRVLGEGYYENREEAEKLIHELYRLQEYGKR